MNRGKKALYNSMASLLSQIVAMICQFILPRLILSSFGSSYNGITSSISQFLSVVALLRAGIGGATRASLYKSLAQNDTIQVSATIKATEIFMRKVAIIFLGMIIIFAFIYPYLVIDEFDWWFSFSLVLVISISTFIQYYFGITYEILFQADQRQYISSLINVVATILNTVIAVFLINLGIGIHGVKIGSTIAFSITPITLNILAKKRYNLNKDVKPDFTSINQRWDAFFHQLAAFIHGNTDITLLTIFTNTKEISVYVVYTLVSSGLKKVMSVLMIGVESAFGNIIANKEIDTLRENVIHYETLLHVFSSVLFGSAIVLVTPFVQVYTHGISDVVYTRYAFGYLVIIAELLYILRSPYEALVNSAGHFKQTKKYAFIEASVNIIISILLVQKYGLVGVVIGTVIAITYRNIVYAFYASGNIVKRSINIFIKRFLITGFTIISVFFFSRFIPELEMVSYINWIIYAIEVTILSAILTLLFNTIFYKKDMIRLIKKLANILIGTKRNT